MAIDFPNSPTTGQTFTVGSKAWVYNGTTWVSYGVSAAVGAFFENDQTIAADYTITTGRNAVSAGPVTINSGVTVTVPSGSAWVVV